jgi:hypothetical protein
MWSSVATLESELDNGKAFAWAGITRIGLPRGWPKPDLMTICTSPEFVDADLLVRLLVEVERYGVSGPFAAQGHLRPAR